MSRRASVRLGLLLLVAAGLVAVVVSLVLDGPGRGAEEAPLTVTRSGAEASERGPDGPQPQPTSQGTTDVRKPAEARRVQEEEREATEARPRGLVVGRVVNEAREPVAGAMVRLLTLDAPGSEGVGASDSTDEQGRFRIETVAAGRVELRAEKRGLGGSATLRSELEARGRWDVGELVVERGAELRARVLYPGGTPVSGLKVRIDAVDSIFAGPGWELSNASTDPDGRVSLLGLDAGTEYRLEHREPGIEGFGDRGRAFPGGVDLELVLEAARVRLHAVGADGDAGRLQRLELAEAETGDVLIAEHAVGGGSLRLHVPIGVSLRAVAQGSEGDRYEALFEVPRGVDWQEVELTPTARSEQAALRLSLSDPGGDPVELYAASLRDAGGGWIHLQRADPRTGAHEALEPGTYELHIGATGREGDSYLHFPDGPRRVELIGGRTTEVEWTAQAGGHVALDLREVPALNDEPYAALSGRPAGRPPEEQRKLIVQYTDGGGYLESIYATLGQRWRTHLPLEPGTWLLRLESAGYRPWEREVYVRGGEVTTVRVVLEPE